MKKITEEKKTLLKAMLGVSDLSDNVQLAISDFPISAIHYELYGGHVELHVESRSSDYAALCRFLDKHLPEDGVSCKCTHKRGFCVFAYMLCEEVKGWGNVEELGQAVIELRNIVQPAIMAYIDMESQKINLAKELVAYYEVCKEQQPFHINVIDELHANENAHTRILTRLLSYRVAGQRVILDSFLAMLPGFSAVASDVNSSSVCFNRDFIDCLVECPGKFAVIVENKIHGAVDQNRQIERYVEVEIRKGIPKDKIWVIYLTMDGSKTVDERSLTQKAQSILRDRFVAMDYRNHILPWLKDEILPNCKMKEDWLISALKQYVDHLEGQFGIRPSQYQLLNQMRGRIYSSVGITSAMSAFEKYSQLGVFSEHIVALKNITDTLQESLVKPVAERFENASLRVLSGICPGRNFNLVDRVSDGFCQIRVDEWGDKFWQIHFEWFPFDYERLMRVGKTDYQLVVHIEDKSLRNKADALLEDGGAAEDCKAVGFSKSVDDNTYYCKKMTVEKSIAEMSGDELTEFLAEMYSMIPKLIEFMEKHELIPSENI